MHLQMMNGLFNSNYMDILKYMHLARVQFMENASAESDRINFCIPVSDQGRRP
ncbi:hypothetical protein D3C87_1822390 [compost metagenome]